MNAQPRRKLISAPSGSDDLIPVDDVVVSGPELLERIERLSAQLALERTQLAAAQKRAAAYVKEQSRNRELSRELKRLSAVEQERDELLAANADLTRQLEGMWFQLRTAEGRAADARGEAGKGLLGRLGKRH